MGGSYPTAEDTVDMFYAIPTVVDIVFILASFKSLT